MYQLKVRKTQKGDDITYSSYTFLDNEEVKSDYKNELMRIVSVESGNQNIDVENYTIIQMLLNHIADEYSYSSTILFDQWHGIYFKYDYKSETPKPKVNVEFYDLLYALIDAYNIFYHIKAGDIDNFINVE